ncbi:hypothetical protein CVT26_001610 [Gymnopilus dilepis]|uniref:F-box domain-containing protein n=1 Tax=Gymnopilus dilepis TaxID=231916 RepID=A0A409VSS9_9AGAR|nr:hypothetical protein CVT26_001610 [Gymnopilus dilepis]
MQQSPRFAPFGPWKSPSTSANHFPRFLSGLLAFPERHFPGVHSPYGPWGIPPLSPEAPSGKHATSLSSVAKPDASTDATLHTKWRECWYKPLNKVAPQIGLGGILQNLKGNCPDWSAKSSPIGPSIPPPTTGESPRFPRSDYEDPTPEQVEIFKASGSRLARILYSTPDDSKASLPSTPRSVVEKHPASPSGMHKNDKLKDDELKITIGGSTGYLSWDHIAQTSNLYSFFQNRDQPASNSLSVEWRDCAVDQTGARGRTTLKLLFRHLNKASPSQTFGSRTCPLSTLRRLAIKVPKVVTDLEPIDLFGRIVKEDDTIDFKSANFVEEFSWSGEFGILALKCLNLPMASLTVLRLTDCLMSVNDAVAITHACPKLEYLTLDSIASPEQLDLGDLIRPSSKDLVDFQHLSSITLRSVLAHGALLNRMGLTALRKLELCLDSDMVYDRADFNNPTIPWSDLESLDIIGKVNQNAYAALQEVCQCTVRCHVV